MFWCNGVGDSCAVGKLQRHPGYIALLDLIEAGGADWDDAASEYSGKCMASLISLAIFSPGEPALAR